MLTLSLLVMLVLLSRPIDDNCADHERVCYCVHYECARGQLTIITLTRNVCGHYECARGQLTIIIVCSL